MDSRKIIRAVALVLTLFIAAAVFASCRKKKSDESTSETLSVSVTTGTETKGGDPISTESESESGESDTNDKVSWSPKAITNSYKYKNETVIFSLVNCPVLTTEGDFKCENINADLMSFCEKFAKITSDWKMIAEERYDNAVSDLIDFECFEKSGDYSAYVKNNIISFVFNISEDSGGAQGSYSLAGKTYDLTLDSPLTLPQLLGKSESDTLTYVKQKFTELIDKNPDMFLSDAKDVLEGEISLEKFYLTDEGLVLFLDAYDIAPFASGIPQVVISYGEIPEM